MTDRATGRTSKILIEGIGRILENPQKKVVVVGRRKEVARDLTYRILDILHVLVSEDFGENISFQWFSFEDANRLDNVQEQYTVITDHS